MERPRPLLALGSPRSPLPRWFLLAVPQGTGAPLKQGAGVECWGVTKPADSGFRSSTSDATGQGNHEPNLAGSLGIKGFRSSSKLPGQRLEVKVEVWAGDGGR